jgi:4-amino-4-deoxy-L-arabinose transferase-like glycosyltransferase
MASHGVFYQKSIGQDFALKLVGEQESHGAPPGYYVLASVLTFWPGTLLLLPALVYAWRQRRERPVRFLLAWAAGTWLAFELVPTKLPHYVLPAYPALATLCAVAMNAWVTDRGRGLRIAYWLSLLLFAIAGIALTVFVTVAPAEFGNGTPLWLYAGAIVAVAVVVSAIRPALSRRAEVALIRACLAAMLVYAIAGFVTVPRLTTLWLSSQMAAAVARHSNPQDPPVIAAGYSEPSIQFMLGTDTALADGAGAARKASVGGGLALVSDDQQSAFLSGIEAAGARADPLETVAGLNYSRGRKTRITLYRIVPHQP